MLFLKKGIIHLLFTITLLVEVCFLMSCSHQDATEDLLNENIKVKLLISKFSFLKQTIAESAINEAQVMAFVDGGDGYQYSYTTPISLKNKDEFLTSFEMTMYTTDLPVKIYFIANADAAILQNIPLVGETEAEIRQKITESFTIDNRNSNFAMWGEYVFQSGISSSLNNSFIRLNVLRDIARVDVLATDVEDVFAMTDVRVFRASNRIQIAPNTYTGSLLVSQPSIPSNSTNSISTTPIFTMGNVFESQLYLSESQAPVLGNETLEATCVIVGGKYDGSNTISYYRLDFNPQIANYPLGQILRNHHYTFNIAAVTSEGWSSPEEAAKNASTNMTAEVVDWVDTTVDIDIYPDSQRYFIISTTLVYFGTSSRLNEVIEYDTNISSFSLRWSNSAGEAIGERGEALANDKFVVSKLQDKHHISVQAVSENLQEGVSIEEYFLIEADRLRILIKIVQR